MKKASRCDIRRVNIYYSTVLLEVMHYTKKIHKAHSPSYSAAAFLLGT